MLKIDGFVKSLKTSFGVIPAKAGIQCFQIVLDACLRRHDGISDFLHHIFVDVKDCEFIADQNHQRNYKPPPIIFINIFFVLLCKTFIKYLTPTD